MRKAGGVAAYVPLSTIDWTTEVTPFSYLAGVPLIEYVLEAAGRCAALDRVEVPAQTPTVEAEANACGIDVLWLANGPPDFWGLAAAACREAEADTVVILGPKSPLIDPGTIEAALERHAQAPERPLVSVERLVEDHPFKLRRREPDGRCVDLMFGSLRYDPEAGGIVHGKTGKPTCFRQNLPPVYEVTQALAVVRSADAAHLAGAVRAGNVAWMEADELLVVDGPLSLLRAELALNP